MLEGEIVVILVISSGREEVAETVDVRLILLDDVYVAHAVDVLDFMTVKVGELVFTDETVMKGDSVAVAVALEVILLGGDAVDVLEELTVFVVLTLAEVVLEVVDVAVEVTVYIGVTVFLTVVDILEEPDDVLD